MRKVFFIYFLVQIAIICFSQTSDLRVKFDSIVAEAEILYRHEKAVWHSTDHLLLDDDLKSNYGGYVVRFSANYDTIIVTYVHRNQTQSIARYIFTADDLENPLRIELRISSLTQEEKELLKLKTTLIKKVIKKIAFYRGFDPNFILLKDSTNYKFYVIMGTRKPDIIPFGNDYLFVANKKGKILTSIKFHSTIIPIEFKMNDSNENTYGCFHTHLRTTPLMTATDICTFRLYGPASGQKMFSVYSPALDIWMTYILSINKIVINPKQ